MILQLHKNLYKYSAVSSGGKYKYSDNVIEEQDEFGNKKIRFKPVSAFETPASLQDLCDSYNAEILKGEINPLILIPIFIIDF